LFQLPGFNGRAVGMNALGHAGVTWLTV
jgi:hypothetical protein